MYDVIVIGGGHNGLVAAYYLARAGARVALFERRHIVGGASVTEELWQGVKVSTGAYVLSLLRERIIKDMELERHGLKVYTKEPGLFLPLPNKKHLFIWNDLKKTKEEISKFSKRDALAYERWNNFMDKLGSLAEILMMNPPPDLGELASMARYFDVNDPDGAEIFRVFFRDASSLLDQFFESDEVKAALAEDSVVGTYASPSTPGTAYVLAHHAIGSVNGIKGAWGYPRGGMGAVTSAMEKAIREAGVDVYTSSAVKRILVENGRATGVVLETGKTVRARALVSNADPKRTFLNLVERENLDSSFIKRVESIKTLGVSYKVVGFLDRLPDFSGSPGYRPEHNSSILIMPSMKYLERAYTDARALGFSREPWLSLNILSSVDDTMAPPGYYSFSIFGQYLPYSKELTKRREEVLEITLEKVREYAPNFKPVKAELITPLDIEDRFGITQGNIFHVDMTPDQMLMFRPLPELSRYKTPIKGLFLCGAGTHPGGGVTGAPGFNASQEVLKFLKEN